MRSGGGALATSLKVPAGPLKGRSAVLPEVASAIGMLTFGSRFVEATKAGVEALGTSALAAASTRVENGQKAPACLGAITIAIIASPATSCHASLLCGENRP
ncbi:hypothetical protein HYV30_02260 [Candidatus Kaiserbacteria bacterium]|nr:hypothetical protein [Candidatus Kaiserbacteria bacterium]